ncbi:MAG: hypothetical protein IT458_05050 [Planctomycetes bacterium]|nr:hypothetical protein [Planctomycetota bacterium]
MSATEVVPNSDTLVLGNGKQLRMQELSMLDLADLEKLTGKKLGEVLNEPIGKDVSVLVWLLVRKEGRKREEILAGNWAMRLEEFQAEFTLKDWHRNKEGLLRFFASALATPTESS